MWRELWRGAARSVEILLQQFDIIIAGDAWRQYQEEEQARHAPREMELLELKRTTLEVDRVFAFAVL
jgi:hypothetical protein